MKTSGLKILRLRGTPAPSISFVSTWRQGLSMQVRLALDLLLPRSISTLLFHFSLLQKIFRFYAAV